MNWKLQRTDWHRTGNCWTWWKIKAHRYYSGNQLVLNWGRLAFVFERKHWSPPIDGSQRRSEPPLASECKPNVNGSLRSLD